MIDKMTKTNRRHTQLFQEYQREPTSREIADSLGVESKRVEEVFRVSRLDTMSLESPTRDGEDRLLGDFIEDGTSVALPELATQQLLKEEMCSVLSTLKNREKRVLELRYGLLDGRTRTLEQVGREFGVTRERTRQIEARALIKLRNPSTSKRLRGFLE
jgi:RNA polymerase primary sigma factor